MNDYHGDRDDQGRPGRPGRGARLRRRPRRRRVRARRRERPRGPPPGRASAPTASRPRRWRAARAARSRSRTSSSSPRRASSRSSTSSSRPTSPARWRRSRTRSPSCRRTRSQVNIIHRGVGGINESDVMLAAASDARHPRLQRAPGRRRARGRRARGRRDPHLLGHLPGARRAARRDAGHARARGGRGRRSAQVEVRQLFRASRIGTIAGSLRHRGQGHARREGARRARRHRHLRHDDRQRCAASTTTCARSQAGFECGIVLANFQDVKEGDVLEVYETRAGRARAR